MDVCLFASSVPQGNSDKCGVDSLYILEHMRFKTRMGVLRHTKRGTVVSDAKLKTKQTKENMEDR